MRIRKRRRGYTSCSFFLVNMLFRVVLDDIYIRVFVEIDDLLL